MWIAGGKEKAWGNDSSLESRFSNKIVDIINKERFCLKVVITNKPNSAVKKDNPLKISNWDCCNQQSIKNKSIKR